MLASQLGHIHSFLVALYIHAFLIRSYIQEFLVLTYSQGVSIVCKYILSVLNGAMIPDQECL